MPEKEYSFEKNQRNKTEKNRLTDENDIIDQRQYAESVSTNNSHRQYEHAGVTGNNRSDSRQRQSVINDSNRYVIADRCESGQSISKTSKVQDAYHANQRQQRNAVYLDHPNNIKQTNEIDQDISGKQHIHGLKTIGPVSQNRMQNNQTDRNLQ